MIFKVKNLGIIKESEINLNKDIILLTGQNNTRKTYLAYSIYRLFKNIAEELIKNINITINLIKELPSIFTPIKETIFNRVSEKYQDGFDYFFSSTGHQSFSKTKLILNISDDLIAKKVLSH